MKNYLKCHVWIVVMYKCIKSAWFCEESFCGNFWTQDVTSSTLRKYFLFFSFLILKMVTGAKLHWTKLKTDGKEDDIFLFSDWDLCVDLIINIAI